MKTTQRLLLFGLFVFLTSAFQDEILNGWNKNNKTNSYEITIEKGSGQDGKNCATIKSMKKKIDGFGALSQRIKADKYIDKKIHLSGFIKTQDVKGSAHFWMRVDGGYKNNEALTSDAMYNRPIKGSTDWKKYDIVLEVPYSAKTITYGAMLRGTGQIWFDNLSIEIAPDSISTTNDFDSPRNLNFED